MKTIHLLTAAALALAAGVRADAPPGATSKNRLFVNGFRMPSIGLEYQRKSLSWHAGMYCTVVSKDSHDENETTWFARAGMTWWLDPYVFLDASYVHGLNHDYRNDPGFMLNPGLQYVFREFLALRLGVAVLAAPDHAYKINPTPGIGIAFAL